MATKRPKGIKNNRSHGLIIFNLWVSLSKQNRACDRVWCKLTFDM